MKMPTLNLELLKGKISDDDYFIAEQIVHNGHLRHSRPVRASGAAQYVWRHVAFIVSPVRAHHCMPLMAFTYLPEGTTRDDERRYLALADRIVDICFSSPDQWHGIRRWSGLI